MRIKSQVPVLALVLIAAAAQGVSAQASLPGRIGFSLSSYPEENGNVTEGQLTYRFSPTWTSALRIKTITLAETFPLLDLERSLNLVRTSTTEFFIHPLELNATGTGRIPIHLSAGLYQSSQRMKEVGFFDLDGDGTVEELNSYVNELVVHFYGPSVELGTRIGQGPLELWASVLVVPYFWFTSAQTIEIEPLVASRGENRYSGQGYPYVVARLQPTVFGFFSPDAEYSFQRFSFATLNPTEDYSSWAAEENSYTVHSLTLRGSIRIPLFDKGRAELGYGRKIVWTLPEDGSAMVDNKGTFKLAFNVAR